MTNKGSAFLRMLLGSGLCLGLLAFNFCNLNPTQDSTANQVVLTVVSDNSLGLIESQPAGISCGTACALTFDAGTSVQLTATPLPGTGATFAGWSGACSGAQNTCSVTLQSGQQVVAQWQRTTSPPTPVSTPSLVAGGLGGPGNVDGTGRAARFSNPRGLATDGAGNLYAADSSNHTIRRIVLATGVVSTLAGTAGASGSTDGTGAAAQFNSPNGLAADGAGNVNGDYGSPYIG